MQTLANSTKRAYTFDTNTAKGKHHVLYTFTRHVLIPRYPRASAGVRAYDIRSVCQIFNVQNLMGYEFCVIGTQYGYWHTSGGDVRTWRTAGGARKALKRYVPL